jgi:hypothetical protein
VSSSSTTGLKFSSPVSIQARPFASIYTKSSTSNSGASEVAQPSTTTETSHQTVQHLVQSPLKSLENATNNLSVYTGSNTSNIKLPVPQTTPSNTVTTSSNRGPLTSTSAHVCTPAQTVVSSSSTTSVSAACKCEPTGSAKPTLDTRALAEASRNLTQTLKQLSSEVLTSRADQPEVSTDSGLEELLGGRNRRFNTGNGKPRHYSGRRITESLGNVTVRGGKDGKNKGGARLSTV